MTWGKFFAGAAAVLALAAALVFYFAFLPGILADDWEAKAREEHETAAMAFPRVFATFSEFTFGIDASRLEKTKSPEAYIQEVRLEAGFARDNLKDTRVTIERAKRDLAAIHRDKLTDVPGPPLIATSGKLGDAHDIASLERRYLGMGREFLARYEKLVDFELRALRQGERAHTDLAKGFASVPAHPSSPEAFARPVERTAAVAERYGRLFGRMKGPGAMREELHVTVAAYRFYSRSLRDLARAVRARDLPRIERFQKDFTRGSKRYFRGEPARLNRLLYHSGYSRTIKTMNRLGDRIQRAHLVLDAS